MGTASLTHQQKIANVTFITDAQDAMKAMNNLMSLSDQIDVTDPNWIKWMQNLASCIQYLQADITGLQQAYAPNKE